MKDIDSPKSDAETSVLLDPSAHKSILVCNGVTNIGVRTAIACLGVKLLPLAVAIAERPGPGGARCAT